MRNSLK
jgi:actin-like protein 6A